MAIKTVNNSKNVKSRNLLSINWTCVNDESMRECAQNDTSRETATDGDAMASPSVAIVLIVSALTIKTIDIDR